MSPKVKYRPYDPPVDLGWQNSSSGWYHTCIFGAYCVELGDGWMFGVPHTGTPGTIGATPIDLDLNPEFCEQLIEDAMAARDNLPPD